MKKYKLIILIIASNGGVYDIFTEYWNKYMNTRSDIKSFFIFGQSSTNTSSFNSFDSFNSSHCFHSLYKDVSIISPTVESFIPGILQKTIYSFEYIEANFEYEYIMRTNLSSFFDINQLMVFINTLPKERLYCGKNNRNYISGSCFILSKDVVKLIIQNKDKIDYNIIDDVSIGKLLRNLNIKLINNMNYKIHNTNTTMNIVSINNTPNFFNYYRLRSLNYIRYNQNANNSKLNNHTKTNGNETIRVFKSIYTKNNNSNKQENTFTQSTTKVNNFVNKNTVVNNNINQIKQPIKLTISKNVSNVIRKSTLSVIQSSKINNNRNNNSKTNLNNQNTNNKKNKTSQKSKTSQKRISRISYIALNQTKAINVIRVKSIK